MNAPKPITAMLKQPTMVAALEYVVFEGGRRVATVTLMVARTAT